jgi:type II secretory pathway component PulJ
MTVSKRKGFTLVEILVACSILMLVMIPTYKILSHGSKSAIKGVQRNNIIMQGQNILSQIKSDLSESGLLLEDGKFHNINNIFSETSDASGNFRITFYSFGGGSYEHQVKRTNSGPESPRRLNKIEYRLIVKTNSVFKTLKRTVWLHPADPGYQISGNTRTMSERVNFFEIRPETITSAGFSRSFFKVSLQLFDQDSNKKSDSPPDPESMFIAEFSETVNPLILNSIINNPGLNRNWYTDPAID